MRSIFNVRLVPLAIITALGFYGWTSTIASQVNTIDAAAKSPASLNSTPSEDVAEMEPLVIATTQSFWLMEQGGNRLPPGSTSRHFYLLNPAKMLLSTHGNRAPASTNNTAVIEQMQFYDYKAWHL